MEDQLFPRRQHTLERLRGQWRWARREADGVADAQLGAALRAHVARLEERAEGCAELHGGGLAYGGDYALVATHRPGCADRAAASGARCAPPPAERKCPAAIGALTRPPSSVRGLRTYT